MNSQGLSGSWEDTVLKDTKSLARPRMEHGREAGEKCRAAVGPGQRPLSPDKHRRSRKMLACALECVCVFGAWQG